VLSELHLFEVLTPLLYASLDREWLPLLTATDASPAYGFGVAVCPITNDRAADVGRLSERRGDYVRLERSGGLLAPELPRIGHPHRLPFSDLDFKIILSHRAARVEHSGTMELKGVKMALQWLLRSTKRFGHRIPMLVDAKAALAAVAKGRSGSVAFRCTLGYINSCLLATNCLLRVVYIPSEDNPADAPSRGKRPRVSVRGLDRPPRYSKVEKLSYKHCRKIARAYDVLKENGMLSSWDTSDSDSTGVDGCSGDAYPYLLADLL